MKYTNIHNLPEPLAMALTPKEHKSRSDISVTGLIKPPRQRLLAKRHEEEVVEDVSDRVWAFFGQVAHGIIEKAGKESGSIQEEYMQHTVNGWKVGAMLDSLDQEGDKLYITDWKVQSVWGKIMNAENGGVSEDYEAQQNLYDYILSASTGIEVDGLRLGAIYRDWKKGDLDKAMSAGRVDYPECQIELLDIEKWPRKVQKEYLEDRVRVHQEAEDLSDDELPVCTPDERWERGEVWAVMKRGRKTSLRNCTSEDEAQRMAAEDPALYVQHRPGKPTKCLNYCNAAPFCSYYAGLVEQGVAAPKLTATQMMEKEAEAAA